MNITHRGGPERNTYIDALRGASIFVVMFLHFGLNLPENFYPLPAIVAADIARNGYYGVTVFFVISGFLITSHTIKHYGSLDKIIPYEFYRSRFARIFPLLAATLVFLTALDLFGIGAFKVPANLSIWNALWAAITFQYNYYYLAGASVGMRPWLPLWSLSIEEMFYIFFPVICLMFRNAWMVPVALMVLVIQGPFARSGWVGIYLWSGCADAIAMGCLVALLAHHKKDVSGALRLVCRLIGLGVMLWQYIFYSIGEFFIFGPSIIALGAALFLFGSLVPQKGFRYFLPLELLGRRSYEIYLIHFPAVALLRMVLPIRWAEFPFVTFVLFLLAVALLAEVIGRKYTDPMNKLIRSRRKATAAPGVVLDFTVPSTKSP
jgi:peptidoglycan/LPS O-acetylase OafA/YrhL